MAIYCANTKQGIFIYSSEKGERIYNVNNILIASSADIKTELASLKSGSDKSGYFHFFQGKTALTLDDVVKKLSLRGKESFVAAYSGDEKILLKVSGKNKKTVHLNEVDCIGNNSGKALAFLEDEKIKHKIKSFADALSLVYYTDGKTNFSHSPYLGLLCAKKPKVLFSERTKLSFEDDNNNNNNEQSHVMQSLVSVLDRISYIYDNNLSKRALNSLKKKAANIALSYAKSWSDPISKTYVGWNSERISKKASETELRPLATIVKDAIGAYVHTAKKAISNYGALVQDELDKTFLSKKRQDIIIGLNPRLVSDVNRVKVELAESLAKTFGSKEYFVFESIPYIAVPCDKNDIDKACYKLNKKRLDYFGPAVSVHSNIISNIDRSRGFYIPELFIKTAADMKIPLSYKLTNMTGRSNKFKKNNPDNSDGMWNLSNIGAYKAHKISRGGGATVLIIDTGAEYRHSEIKHAFGTEKGKNFINGSSDPNDDNGHGTHCAGTVAGKDTGVAPDAGIIAAKVLDGNGSGTTTAIIAAIDYGIKKNDVDVISMSLGSRYPSAAGAAVCMEAYKSGIIVCAAAGNEYFGASYPAAYDGVISVAAVDRNNQHADFSNIHNTVDISCPGVNIYSSYLGNSYRLLSGTSMATPHVAGVSALAVGVRNNLKPTDFEEIMGSVAEKLGSGEAQQKEKYGEGLARADKIVEKLYTKMFPYEKIKTQLNSFNPFNSFKALKPLNSFNPIKALKQLNPSRWKYGR